MDRATAAVATNRRPTTVEDLLPFLESMADSLAAIETKHEKLESAVEDVKADTEEILNSLENISFKADYPGLSEDLA